MTKQEVRNQIAQTRKAEKQETLREHLHAKQKAILEDPQRKKWNKYHCWNYRTVEGIERDVRNGWEFIIEDGIIKATNNPTIIEEAV